MKDHRLPTQLQVADRVHDLHWQVEHSNRNIWLARAGDVACVAVQSHNHLIVGYLNAFPRRGTIGIEGHMIPPGFGRWHFEVVGRPENPGTATRYGRENARKHLVRLEPVEGVLIYGGPDANAPGGAGIYMESSWATGCPEGMVGCLQMLVGWANRSWIWRLDPQRFDAGQIEWMRLHDCIEDYYGHDKTGTIQPKGYGGSSRIYGNYKTLDHAHLVRMIHPAVALAREEKKAGLVGVGQLMLDAITEDVSSAWLDQNLNDTRSGWSSNWWSIEGIQRFSGGAGSPHLGRELNAALQVLAAEAELRGHCYDLCHFINMLWECYDEQRHVLYRISAEESGVPSHKYNHKVYDEQWSHSIPQGEQPDVYKGFEQELVWLGLRRAVEALKATPCDSVDYRPAVIAGERMVAELHERATTGQHRALEVIEKRGWSSIEVAPWTRVINGTEDLDQVRAMHQNLNYPWWADNPMNAWTGDLGELE